ncbi:MAG: hypothetical protein G01um101416_1202 [Microgenomates group bacterium Gr01-1014_16]|nr:MAG: hypothetical protein G01um101416_1202 [Microgenomates group bacterium Gr01-1014_16]
MSIIRFTKKNMLDQTRHRVNLVEILKDIYTDPGLRTVLGFKGGTAAMLFYDLPRLSVDLDFDLLDDEKKEQVFAGIRRILEKRGKIDEAVEKRYTLLFLVSYEKGQRMIKLDISKRRNKAEFEPRVYLGVPMLVMKREDMLAGKLAALLTRRKFATRDVFDVWYFLKEKWEICGEVLEEQTGMSVKKGIVEAVKRVLGIDRRQLLHGWGELLDDKQKAWVREKLIDETLFQLRLRQKFLS